MAELKRRSSSGQWAASLHICLFAATAAAQLTSATLFSANDLAAAERSAGGRLARGAIEIKPNGASQFGPRLVEPAATGPIRVRRQTTNSTTINKRSKDKKNKKKAPSKEKKAIIVECLAAHNKLRQLHQVPNLEWDEKLATFAQKRSDHIAKSDGAEFGHPPDLPFGENLFWHSSPEKGCEMMVRSWYDEIELYDFKAPIFAPATGHFTQVIWRDTTRVGCAFAESSGSRGGLYLTCNYDPPGNFAGEFPQNVPAIASGDASTQRSVSMPSTTTAAAVSTTTAVGQSATTTLAPTAEDSPAAKPKSKKKKKKKKKKGKGKKKKGDEESDKKKNNKKKSKGKKKRKSSKKTTTTTMTTSTTPGPSAS